MPEETKQQQPLTPYDFLKTVSGAPSPAEIESFKTQAPGGRMRIFSPDGSAKRVYIVRAISGLEMESINKQIPENASNPELEMQIAACVKATVWTNTTQDGMTDELYWRRATAGLAITMFRLISKLSDFLDPELLETLSADL
jgi:hypothetical protein